MYKLLARTTDNRMVMHHETFEVYDDAVNVWFRHDDARREGNRPHVQWYAVREMTDVSYGVARVERDAFVDAGMLQMGRLTSREYGEVIGALQIFRDRTLAEKGYEPQDVASALHKLLDGCTPSTIGLEFRLIEA